MDAIATVSVDGGILEGGGQLVRNAVSFSAIFLKPVSIFNIRKNRKQGGLKAQHAAGLKLVEQICDANTQGIESGSASITFVPEKLAQCGQYTADTGTAGSTALLLQIALPCLIFASPSNITQETVSYVTFRGGTNAASAPHIDYMQHVLLPFLRSHFGVVVNLDIRRRGYWPKGGGEVVVTIPTVFHTLSSLNLTIRGQVTLVRGTAFVAGTLPTRIADLMAQAAKSILVANGVGAEIIDIDVLKDDNAIGNGSGIVLWAHTTGGCIIGGSAVGIRGVNATKTGQQAGEELLRNLSYEACVDEYLQDQIIIFMALAKGTSRVAIGPMTMHTKTAIYLAETLSGASFQFERGTGTQPGILVCNGIGFHSPVITDKCLNN